MLSALLMAAALPLAAMAFEFPKDNRMVQQPGLIRYPLTVNAGAPCKNRILKRQVGVDVEAEKSGFFYSIELQLGTPPQSVRVNFDTGSAELWVNPVCSKSTDPQFCQQMGRFNGSRTFVDTNITHRLNYGTGFAKLEYGYDYVQIGSARISQQMFGVATDSAFASTGILGAGPNLKGWKSDYPLVLDNLVAQNFTKSRAFSLDIRSIESKRGSVVFGGIDTKKFSGRLEKRPIIPAEQSPDGLTRYWIYLDGITINKPDGTEAQIFNKVNGQAVLLDSGYTVSALPTPLFNKIHDAFPGITPPPEGDKSGLYRVPCFYADEKGSVNFKFGATIVQVAYQDFIWKQADSSACILGVTPDDKFPVLGDTFLRAAYVVYDMDNQNVHVANNEDCGSALIPIGSGPDAVPAVEGGCGPSNFTNSTFPIRLPSFLPSLLPPLVSSLLPTIKLPISISVASQSSGASTSNSISATPTAGTVTSAVATSQPDAATSSATTTVVTVQPLSTVAWSNTTSSSVSTSTLTATKLQTVSSCPPDVTGCTVGSVAPQTSVGSSAGDPASSPSLASSSNTLQPAAASPSSVDTNAAVASQPSSSSQDTTFTSTSTKTQTQTLTVSACLGSSSPCPSSQATTQAPAPAGDTTITSTSTKTQTLTVSACSGSTPCPNGQATTQAMAPAEPLNTESTATFNLPQISTCRQGDAGCDPGSKMTTTFTVTVQPHSTADTPSPAPGCGDTCAVPSPQQTPPPQNVGPVTKAVVASAANATAPYATNSSMVVPPVSNPANTSVDSITTVATGPSGQNPYSTSSPSSVSALPVTGGAPTGFCVSVLARSIALGAMAFAIL